jgi:hypothetical protein
MSPSPIIGRGFGWSGGSIPTAGTYGNLIIPFLADIRRVWTGAMAQASVESTGSETWDFSSAASWTLLVSVNGGAAQTLTILRASFVDSTAATSAEVASQLDAGIVGGGSYALTDGRVAIEADIISSSTTTLRVAGGTANAVLLFPTTTETQSGYNDLLGGVRAVADTTQTGVQGRREHTIVTVHCQIDRSRWGEQDMTAGGVNEVAEIILTLDMRELESIGLTRVDGAPRFNRGDRLERIRTIRNVSVEAFPDPQGVRVEKVERAGHGLSLTNPRPNLVYLHCARDRVTR